MGIFYIVLIGWKNRLNLRINQSRLLDQISTVVGWTGFV